MPKDSFGGAYLVKHMDAPTRVAAYFEDLIERCNRSGQGRPTSLPAHDQYIFYVISTRCEMDINGFGSVFDQLLEESEISVLITALNELGCTTLSDAFSTAHDRLAEAGFFDDDEMMVCDLAMENGGFLDDIEETVRNSNLMWDLDNSLAKLLPEEAK